MQVSAAHQAVPAAIVSDYFDCINAAKALPSKRLHLLYALSHDVLVNAWHTLVAVQYNSIPVMAYSKRSFCHNSTMHPCCAVCMTASSSSRWAVMHHSWQQAAWGHLSGMATFSSMSDMSCRAAPCIRLMSQLGTVSPWPVADCRRVLMRSRRDRSLSTVSSTRISGGRRCETSCRTCCWILLSLPACQQCYAGLRQGVAIHFTTLASVPTLLCRHRVPV